jgi:hypothetical protein
VWRHSNKISNNFEELKLNTIKMKSINIAIQRNKNKEIVLHKTDLAEFKLINFILFDKKNSAGIRIFEL